MTFKCKMCGGDLVIEAESTVCECECCGTKQTIPNADNEKKTNLFNRANRLRMNAEFDKASAVYESLVAEFPEEAEAYWGLCLCAYGIEYVDDPATGKKIPTCHRTLPTSIMEDANFEQACDYADTIARRIYRDEAKAIDRIQKDILSIVASEAPYDVFICYKETAEDGGRTEDSVLAQDIYDALTVKGMKVFFSRITLEDKLGQQYEPYIYAALSSAKVMLAIGTQFEYYDAVWVKNEWSRFLSMMKINRGKTLIPCFKGLDAYDMPKEFKGLQAQDMGKLGWMQDLVRGVEKLCGKNQPAANVVQVVQQVSTANSDIENLMKRAWLFMGDEEWKSADEYFDRVLDINAEYAPAYVGKVCVELKIKKEEELAEQHKELTQNKHWKKVMQFSTDEQRGVYEEYEVRIRENITAYQEAKRQAEMREREARRQEEIRLKEAERLENLRKEEEKRQQGFLEEYNKANKVAEQGVYAYAYLLYKQLDGFRDSEDLAEEAAKHWLERYKKAYPDSILPDLTTKLEELRKNAIKKKERLEKLKKRKEDLLQIINELQEQVETLQGEIDQIHGLFSNMKKRKVQSNVDEAKSQRQKHEIELRQIDAQIGQAEKEVNEAEKGIKGVENALSQSMTGCFTDELRNKMESDGREAQTRDKKYAIGETIVFGTYVKAVEWTTEKMKIEWEILDRDGQNALLLSRYALDVKPYHHSKTPITWEQCSLRNWLNDSFINKAFDKKEKQAIVGTKIHNDQSQGEKWKDLYSGNTKNISGGNDTYDKVFLLSFAESKKYGVSKSGARFTPYVIKMGAQRIEYNTVQWWTRSPGVEAYEASYVGTILSNIGYHCDVNDTRTAVRPALWVNLESGIF